MKTTADLIKLIPEIVELVEGNEHNFGRTVGEQDESGWYPVDEGGRNKVYYEEDGWYVEVTYQCAGVFEYYSRDWLTPLSYEMTCGHGHVIGIDIEHYDEESGEVSTFSKDDIKPLEEEIDKVLEHIE